MLLTFCQETANNFQLKRTMNLCQAHPGSKRVFRSYSTNNLDTKSYPNTVSISTAIDCLEDEQIVRKDQGFTQTLIETSSPALPVRRRCVTISGGESEPKQTLKHSKSFAALKSTTNSREHHEQKKYSFKKLFDKKKPGPLLSHEQSERESSSPTVAEKKSKPKPVLLRSLSSSCLSLATKSRPKLMNRLSDSRLIPLRRNTSSSKTNEEHRVSWPVNKPVENKTPTGGKTCSRTGSIATRLKDAFRFRHSGEISKRDSRNMVTRFEVELAITKDDRSKLLSFINSKSINLNAKDYYGKTLLHTACSVGNYQCAQILLNAGAKVDIQDQAGFTPLHCAVVANHVPCAAVLIAAGADVLTSTRTMHTALTLAHEEEMILLVGRSLLLRGTRIKTGTADDKKCWSLRETKL